MILPVFLQTVINLIMLSIGGLGEEERGREGRELM